MAVKKKATKKVAKKKAPAKKVAVKKVACGNCTKLKKLVAEVTAKYDALVAKCIKKGKKKWIS